MKNVIRYVKQQPMSCLLVLIIWIICMVPVPETPLDDVKFIDKWTHLAMYGTLVLVIMTEYGRRKEASSPASSYRGGACSAESRFDLRRLVVGGLLAPIMMGGLVELAQAYLTNGVRSGDWLDFAANSVGAILGAVIGIPLARFLATQKKDD